MARQREDLTGRKFNSLTVISLNEEVSKQKKKSHWNCKCDCGNEIVVCSGSLKSGATTDCGCSRKKELIGQRFGRLTVISLNEEVSKQKGRAYWNCKCDCENEKVVCGRYLKDGRTTSCGCYNKDVAYSKMKEIWQDEEMKLKMNYKGGITPIKRHLENLPIVKQWHGNSKQQANYTCELTGKVGYKLNTHHLKAFSTIVKEAHELHNIQVKPQVKDYTEEELYKLEKYVASWHKDNSNAVVLSEEVHKLFHKLYGKGDNTPEQFEEFRERYIAGEFKDLI